MKIQLNKNLRKHPVISGIPISYAYQTGYLAFCARQWAVIIPSYQFAMVPNKPPSLQSWDQSRQPRYKLLFPSLYRLTKAKCGHVAFLRLWGTSRNIQSYTNVLYTTYVP